MHSRAFLTIDQIYLSIEKYIFQTYGNPGFLCAGPIADDIHNLQNLRILHLANTDMTGMSSTFCRAKRMCLIEHCHSYAWPSSEQIHSANLISSF